MTSCVAFISDTRALFLLVARSASSRVLGLTNVIAMASAASTDPFYLVKDDIQASVSMKVMCWGITLPCQCQAQTCTFSPDSRSIMWGYIYVSAERHHPRT